MLVPRIEVTPIFHGNPQAEVRYTEYQNLGCNQTYYDVNYDSEARPECKDLLNMVSVYVFNGATRKYSDTSLCNGSEVRLFRQTSYHS